ncbi:peritrophin-1-like [Toxorhynchites rutilus septentrionalis]|uniref:peritrophin-1-like n=1 Tax=Toxorhynchites rutilus septentrionalis TaxID=329112 RepID=UPI0024784F4A|nr:peritrophin-1-like [Toxorhynchites rutilus septentrionalis]
MPQLISISLFVVFFGANTLADPIACDNPNNKVQLQSVSSSCNRFLVCVLNTGTEIACPNGLYFDQNDGKCDKPEKVLCYKSDDEENCHPACVGDAENVAHNEKCEKYISCVNGCDGTMKTCPAGLYFNPILLECDTPDHAECLLNICADNADEKWIIVGSINSCRRYYFCFGKTVIPQNCAYGTFFDPTTLRCELDSVTNPCDVNRLPTPPDSVIELCKPDAELEYIPHPDDRTVYFRCLNGNLTVRQCPPGLVFDNRLQQCNFPGAVV